MNFKIEYMQDWQIPLPLREVQDEIVEKINREKRIIEGADTLIDSVYINLEVPENVQLKPIGEAVLETKNGWSPNCNGGSHKVLSLSCLSNGKVDFSAIKFSSEIRNDMERFYVKDGDFFYSRGNTKELVALAAIAYDSPDKVIYPDLLTRVVFDKNKILPEFAVYLFNSELGRKYFGVVPEGASPSMVKVSSDYMKRFQVPYLGDLQTQKQIVKNLDQQMQSLTAVKFLKRVAQNKIENILSSLWTE